jgi:hypothetical protein
MGEAVSDIASTRDAQYVGPGCTCVWLPETRWSYRAARPDAQAEQWAALIISPGRSPSHRSPGCRAAHEGLTPGQRWRSPGSIPSDTLLIAGDRAQPPRRRWIDTTWLVFGLMTTVTGAPRTAVIRPA